MTVCPLIKPKLRLLCVSGCEEVSSAVWLLAEEEELLPTGLRGERLPLFSAVFVALCLMRLRSASIKICLTFFVFGLLGSKTSGFCFLGLICSSKRIKT